MRLGSTRGCASHCTGSRRLLPALDAKESRMREIHSLAHLTTELKQMAQDVGEIADVLVALQFQDRVNPIPIHVQDDMAKLEQRIDAGGLQGEAAEANTWLEELSRTYTTAEQRALHYGAPQAAAAASEVTFF
jgi:methyl-accepting chemotaxis protein